MREDLSELAAAFAAALHDAGIPVGADRAARFARAITALVPSTTRQLRHCALATLVSDPDQVPTFDTIFQAVFETPADPAGQRGQSGDSPRTFATAPARSIMDGSGRAAGQHLREANVPALASAVDRLATRDFAELSAEELALLAGLMRAITLSTPVRPSRRRRTAPHGARIDLRRTLTAARRTGGHPARLRRFNQRPKPRKLVVLCDISGSMEPYARAMLQLLYCAAGAARAEIFTFATRLTRLTPVLRRTRPSVALERAGHTAPDWSSGTRIASCLAEFNRRHGRRGMARGALILIVSDGWDTDHPTQLDKHMAQLSRVAFRIVWANPRTASPRYRPLAGGMAAAWPHCDAVVSAHNLNALNALTHALADPIRRRHAVPRPALWHGVHSIPTTKDTCH
jgi:uncharacterized protein with von Willebrand factor type A (vWA) domain